MNETLPIVGVMGSGTHEHRELAEELGAFLASLSVHLLTGGGAGVMLAVSRAFTAVRDRKGKTIGVVPGDFASGRSPAGTPAGYPNPYIEIPILTHLPLSGRQGTDARSRNHINVLSSNAVVALPGGPGTAGEVELCLRYGRPVIAYGRPGAGDFAQLPEAAETATDFNTVQTFLRRHLAAP